MWGGCRACDWVENRKRAKSLLAPGMYSRCAHYVYMFGDLATDVTRCRRSIPTDRLKIIGEISEWLRINAPSRKYRDKEIKKKKTHIQCSCSWSTEHDTLINKLALRLTQSAPSHLRSRIPETRSKQTGGGIANNLITLLRILMIWWQIQHCLMKALINPQQSAELLSSKEDCEHLLVNVL